VKTVQIVVTIDTLQQQQHGSCSSFHTSISFITINYNACYLSTTTYMHSNILHAKYFTGLTPFLPPNQQHKNTKGTDSVHKVQKCLRKCL